MAERINEQGWHLVDVSKESLHFNAETTSAGGRALLARRDFSSPAEIFSSIFPPDFIGDVLSTILEANPDAFYSNTGSHGTRNTKVNPADVYQALACRVWIQGRGVSAGATSKIAMRNALTFLQDRSRERLNGVRKTCMIHAKVHITGGGDLEKRLCAQFQSLVVSLGEVLCCDEKLFRFTGMGGIVRKVPSKPARIGIWHYQGVVTLPNEDPLLVYTRTHNTSSNLGESTQTSEIVGEWADLVEKFHQKTVICMDSYYLDARGRENLRLRQVRYIAALKPDRFKTIVNFLNPQVRNTGDSAWAWNETRGEAAVYHSSRDKNIGKKFILSNCFFLLPQPQPRDAVPIYDEYKVMFSACDAFNQRMHGRTFPYRLPKDTNLAEQRNIWNYLFTSSIINTWNVWRAVLHNRDAECELPDFRQFCDSLCLDIVDKLCF